MSPTTGLIALFGLGVCTGLVLTVLIIAAVDWWDERKHRPRPPLMTMKWDGANWRFPKRNRTAR